MASSPTAIGPESVIPVSEVTERSPPMVGGAEVDRADGRDVRVAAGPDRCSVIVAADLRHRSTEGRRR